MDKNNEKRKYSIIDNKTKRYLEDAILKNEKGLCINKFKADYVLNKDISEIKVGEKIFIDGINMEITEIGKNCYPDFCELCKLNGKSCLLKYGVAFAK